MSERFDWRTEEDEWEGVSGDDSKIKVHRRRIRPWFIVTAIGLLLVAGLIFRQARQQLLRIEETHITDITSSFQLLRHAMEREDGELFRTMLSGSDLAWAMAQQDLFARGWLDDKRPFGLERQIESPKILEVNLSPQLQSAEVVIEERFVPTDPNGLSETITLRRDDIYRAGERWLWSPPRDEYWGGNIDDHLSGHYLTFFFPKRDLEVAERLLLDLDDMLIAWCADVDSNVCSSDLIVQVRFSRDPASLIELSEEFYSSGYTSNRLRFTGRSYSMALPTPSLVGIPQDEASYQALKRGYGRQVIGSILAELLNKDCCNNEELYRGVIRYYLARLGLLSQVDDLSEVDNENPQWPVHDMKLFCVGESNRFTNLLGYDIRTGDWHLDFEGRQLASMRGMPDGSGVLFLERLSDDETVRNRLILWRDGIELVLFEQEMAEDEVESFNWEVRENEQQLLVEVPDLTRGVSAYHTFDLANCDMNGCQSIVKHALGRPTWSPDGTQLLVREYGLIWRQKGFLNSPIADGVAPFWVDEDTFGFVHQVGDEQLVVVQDDTGDDPAAVLGTGSLREALPEDTRPTKIAVGHVKANAIEVDTWLILAFGLSSDNRTGEAYIFNFDPSTQEITLFLRSEHIHSFSTSPSGEWLAINYYDPDIQHWIIQIHNLLTKTIWQTLPPSAYIAQEAPKITWSPDGTELLVIDQGIATLVNPKLELEWSIVPPDPGCISGALVDGIASQQIK